mmetsp:Transcript_30611/g.43442  ORF Transcript_30611/g.43442 Transcript_30611/m.43442 type:complete len:214 (-) Transcript_30611:566-1207(-)
MKTMWGDSPIITIKDSIRHKLYKFDLFWSFCISSGGHLCFHLLKSGRLFSVFPEIPTNPKQHDEDNTQPGDQINYNGIVWLSAFFDISRVLFKILVPRSFNVHIDSEENRIKGPVQQNSGQDDTSNSDTVVVLVCLALHKLSNHVNRLKCCRKRMNRENTSEKQNNPLFFHTRVGRTGIAVAAQQKDVQKVFSTSQSNGDANHAGGDSCRFLP